MDAVFCAMSPNSSLRSYVETLSDFSLAKLRRILRVHYQERAVFGVYQEYANKAMSRRINSYTALWTSVTK